MTTNHAEVIRKALFRSSLPNTVYEAAIDALDALTREVDEAKSANQRVDEFRKEVNDTYTALGTTFYMDPPDGGDPGIAVMVGRLKAHKDELESELISSRGELARARGEERERIIAAIWPILELHMSCAGRDEVNAALEIPVCLCELGQLADPACPHHGIGSPDHFAMLGTTIAAQAERIKALEEWVNRVLNEVPCKELPGDLDLCILDRAALVPKEAQG